MDPKANIEEQLRIACHIVYEFENRKGDWNEQSYRLAELVIALDEWQRRGGFSPYTR